MTEQLALQQKLHNPTRRSDESFEDYKKRRKDSNELVKFIQRGRHIFQSVVFTPAEDKDGNPIMKRTAHTYRRPVEDWVLA